MIPSWLQAKSDLRFMNEFRSLVHSLWAKEDAASKGGTRPIARGFTEYQQVIQARASENPEYTALRDRIAKGMTRAIRLAHRHAAVVDISVAPAPAIGGPIQPINLFYTVLRDTTWDGVGRQWVDDSLAQTVGACEAQVAKSFRQMVNPLCWIKEALVLAVRLPFILVSVSGFDVGKVEDHALGKLFKLLELAAIAYLLIAFGFSHADLKDLLSKVLGK